MKHPLQIPAIIGLQKLATSIGRPIVQWITEPHPLIALGFISTALAHYGILQLFPIEPRTKILQEAFRTRAGYSLILPVMIITFICFTATRRLMFHGGVALKQHQDTELDDRWPQQRIGYKQGLVWFIFGIGCTYLWIANAVSKIVEVTCVAVAQTIRFVLVLIPTILGRTLIWTLRFFHSTRSYMVGFYIMLLLTISVQFAVSHPTLLSVTTVFRVFMPIVVIVSSWQMYQTLDRIGKRYPKTPS